MIGSNPTWKLQVSGLAPNTEVTQIQSSSCAVCLEATTKKNTRSQPLLMWTIKKIWHCTEENGGWVGGGEIGKKKITKQKCLLSVFFVLDLLGMLWVSRCMAEPWGLDGFKPVSTWVLALNAPKAPKQCSAQRESFFWVCLEPGQSKI